MKRLFSLLPLFISIFVCSSCEVGNALIDTAHGFVYNYTNNYVNRSGDQQLVDNWNNIKNDLKPDQSYAAATGSSIAKGDWKGVIINSAGAGAVAAGVDENLVALGESGITNWINGNKKATVIDIAQIGTHIAAGSAANKIDQLFDSQRKINQINQEYRENSRNGMSESEARKIKNSKIGQEIGNVINWGIERDKEIKKEKLLRHKQIRDAIIQRGYSYSEAKYISSFIEEFGYTRNKDGSIASIEDVLNQYNVGYKTSSSEDSFFDNNIVINKPKETNSIASPVNIEQKPSENLIVNNEQENAIKLIEETVLNCYALDETNLSAAKKMELDQVAKKMMQFENIIITIVGHTCNIGTQEVNQNIGERRAKAAKNYLMSKGVSENRIQIESRDFAEPVAKNDNEDHRRQNRRVTFIVK